MVQKFAGVSEGQVQDFKVSIGSNEYKYILVMLDVCSRLLFLRPLSSKYAAEVASTLLQLFSDVGLPKIVQSDQGGEFKGVAHYLMKSLGVHIIHSRPYHPQSQDYSHVVYCTQCH